MHALPPADPEAFERSILRRRWLNALHRMGIATVADLRGTPQKRLLEIPMVGRKTVGRHRRGALRSVGLFDGFDRVLGLPPARLICERDSELVRMRQQGATIDAIARRFEISRVRVRQILDRDGW